MKLLPFTTGKVFDTSVMILVGLTRRAAEAAGLFVEADICFIRFMGPMDPTEGSGIGAPILSVVGATHDDTRSHPLRAEAAEFKVPADGDTAVTRRKGEIARAASGYAAAPTPAINSRRHSITSSARSRINGGTARSSALAVLRFRTISNFLGI
jgi:hypothetical protein